MVFRTVVIVSLLLVSLSTTPLRSLAAEEPSLAQYYGFGPVELIKLERRSRNLLSGDLNSDGRSDLIVVDNSHSRLDLLIQKDVGNATDDSEELDVNEVANSTRFEHEKLAVEKEVLSLILGDFNHDERTDIAYLASPDTLMIHLQSEKADWNETRKFRLPDLESIPWTLAAGDLNQDNMDDLVVLGKNATFVYYQEPEKGLVSPLEIMNTSEKLSIAQIADVNGDGLNDLCYSAGNDRTRFLAARLQDSTGKLGPELQFDLQRPRAITVSNIDGEPGKEIVSIDSQSGRIKVLKLETEPVEPDEGGTHLANRLIQFGFGALASGSDRELAVGDLNGDGLQDVLVTDPAAARIFAFEQNENHQLSLGESFPSLMAISQLRMFDINQDGSDEVLVLSNEEKTLGISEFIDGRLSFPQTLPLPLKEAPHVIDILESSDGSAPTVVYLSGTSPKQELHSFQLKRTDSGFEMIESRLIQEVELAKATPEKMTHCDANADGIPDLLIFHGRGRPPKLLVGIAEGKYKEIPDYPGIGLTASAPGKLFIPSDKGYPLYDAQSKFARSLVLEENGRWQVENQFNANEANARIEGVASLDLDQDDDPEVVLIDGGVDKLRIMQKNENGNYRLWKEVELGGFSYIRNTIADLNGDNLPDLILLGKSSFAVLFANARYPDIKELATFESDLKSSYFSDVLCGDVNNDGHVDVIGIDTRSQRIEILDYNPPKGLRTTLNFHVFEEKGFQRGDDSRGSDPREGLVVDVTGDGLPDVVLLSHDRILVYPQEAPPKAAVTTSDQ
ncbi:FG-GAP repeat protein [Polystyrenella longa]|uniref:FG-GAP repeat protein n=1 Tax=Polystyrenella longa TaxID=2528007 RepID=A0A518CJ23_9PLAN|nr:VCBS repeat-containing protein [Polystyrenella longa]QDU79233.1 FG-GAP repeat protein [Polystyrenella longa]